MNCSFAAANKVFQEQLKKTGAGFFDYYLLHSVDNENLSTYEKCGCFRWLLEKKSRGL